MRSIVLDTEPPAQRRSRRPDHRIGRYRDPEPARHGKPLPTRYINPEGARASKARSRCTASPTSPPQDKPKFREIAARVPRLHPGRGAGDPQRGFRRRILNLELGRLGLPRSKRTVRRVDSLKLCARSCPGKENSLGRLVAKRYEVDHAHRTSTAHCSTRRFSRRVYLAMTRGQDSLCDRTRPAAPGPGNATATQDERPRLIVFCPVRKSSPSMRACSPTSRREQGAMRVRRFETAVEMFDRV